jgi:hypothetical protein
MPSLHRRTLLMIAAPFLIAGCGIVDLIKGNEVATVRMFATHSGSPTDDGWPDYGDSITTRVFTNDMGWLISLSEVYVTTAEVRLVECSAELGEEIEMFWGACPEDFVHTDDRESLALGAITVGDGSYCRIDVTFAPYVPSEQSADHINPENPMIENHTVLINGVARRGMGPDIEEVPFQVLSDVAVTARANISKLDNGTAFKLDDENVPRDLTILKTYDTFFEGIDFSVATPEEIETAVLAGLEFDTVIYKGAEI